MSARIQVKPVDGAVVRRIAQSFDLPHFIAATLAARGVTTDEAVERFLNPSLERDWLDPYAIEGMEAVIDQLVTAIKQHERILVFGDFDLDGISATTIMTRGLRAFGTDAIPFIPLRFEEGYGLSTKAIERVLTYEPDLVITVDNGIAAKAEVADLLERGIKVIITDHHEPAELVPEGVPLIDPKCSDNPSAILAGAGVALKVVQALGGRLGKPYLWRDLVDFATLGTVADLMPMIDENRALVSCGLAMLNDAPRPCIEALMFHAKVKPGELTSVNLGFTLVPRLNAAGRMGNAQLALDLLMCDDPTECMNLAAQLEDNNNKRRQIESELSEIAQEQAAQIYRGQRALIVSGQGWHEGVKGIVASRLVNKYGVPSLLFTIEDGEARGSGRSVGDINLFKAVESCKHLLTRYGGHGAAVGVTLPAKNLDAFYQELCAYMDALPAESFEGKIVADALVDLGELTLDNVAKIERLAPFGQENPKPCYLAAGVFLMQPKAVGAQKDHLSAQLSDGVHNVSAIMFRCPNISELLTCKTVVNAVFSAQIDTWKNYRTVKAMVDYLEPVDPQSSCDCSDSCRSFLQDLFSRYDQNASSIGCEEASAETSGSPDVSRTEWERLAQTDPAALRTRLVESFLGQRTLHEAQLKTLECLEAGDSVFTLMGTGRGKSIIFHLYAIELALKQHKTSIFLYPLRALISDQCFHLRQAVAPFGITVYELTGASTPEERAAVRQALEAGKADIILTTPEYLACHADELAQCANVGFVTIDEAHHVGLAREDFRVAYKHISESLEKLGNPQVLALTATANDDIAETLIELLPLDVFITDEAVRANLHVDDKRNIRKKDLYLANIIAQGDQTIVYVNSRMETIMLTKRLRELVPHLAHRIGFYNAGLSRSERTSMEELFRNGELSVLVATSAFGEGIDIPHIRHVVLYHMPFSEVEFNQMSGRAGRDGEDAYIHLLFGKGDSSINQSILRDATPSHDDMAQIYRELRRQQRASQQEFYAFAFDQLAKSATSLIPTFSISVSQTRSGVAVFEELGLVKTRTETANNITQHYLHVVDYKGKVELVESVRYQEGMDEIASFTRFQDWVLHQPCEELERRIQKPLLPRNKKEGL
ncbi:single-stranded-DNA-specific exonuclease RecJ [Anaerotardibacter muris]|uniref:single-stranded-DNA-specific exonuclease RecJ n=1 Tax=Anaerotardibacter muris TaxID=2941505 RepID=UPI00203E7C86|nr:single-stranded-DNA-specific exonuclease RecJ [Anaerotardibacter muris]